MIKHNKEDWIAIEGTDGAEINIERYKVNPKAIVPFSDDTKILISLNDCESISLNKEDALMIANKILDFIKE